eukprot:5501883-Pyramimonas_sp.AAC.1
MSAPRGGPEGVPQARCARVISDVLTLPSIPCHGISAYPDIAWRGDPPQWRGSGYCKPSNGPIPFGKHMLFLEDSSLELSEHPRRPARLRRSPQDGPRGSLQSFKTAQESPKKGQGAPNAAHEGLRAAPRGGPQG